MEKAEEFWSQGKTADHSRSYWANPWLHHVASRATGGLWYMEYVRDRYFGGPANLALSIGCGFGEVDRLAYKKQIFKEVIGLDFSASAVAAAEQAAAEEGVPATYIRADLNIDPLPDRRFDLIFDYASSHHIAQLETLYGRIEQALAYDGYFVLYGYCGPARMQWSSQTIELVNELLGRMPPRLRPMGSLGRASIWSFMAADPSEAVRGPEVVDLARAFFDVVEEIDIGFTLTHPMFYANAYAMDPEDPYEQTLFRLACEYERALVCEKKIPADTKLMVCRRRAYDPYRPEFRV